jgi:predicted ester cyclase
VSEEENLALIRRTVEAFNRGDLAGVDALFAADYVDHDPGRAGLPPGPEGVKQAWRLFRAAFPDLHASIEDTVVAGDKVAVRGVVRGTHRGDLLGIAPTGRVVTVPLLDINRIAAGRLAERWGLIDMLGLLQQVGAAPAPGTGA